MKLRTSFFNWAIFKKDILRFIPLWALYTVGLLIMLPSVALSSVFGNPGINVTDLIQTFAFFNFFYGLLSAQLLFGELFNSRLCNALHAMPATRTARFISHLAAGLAFSFIPNFLMMVLMLPNLQEFWYLAPMWLLAADVQYLFFFGVGVFSALCVGSRFAMVLVYGIINFLEAIAYWFVYSVFSPVLPGVVFDFNDFGQFCPFVHLLTENDYFAFTNVGKDGITGQRVYRFDGLGDIWWYVLILAGVGIAFLAIAWLMYRRRKLETAGDFIAVKWIKPIFLLLYTLCAGAFLSLFSALFGQVGWIMLVLGLLIGFFTGSMLLERTIRVFKKKNFLRLAIITVVALLAVGAAKLDVLGIVRYVPNMEDVEYIQISRYGDKKVYSQKQKEMVHQIHTAGIEKQCDSDCREAHRNFYMEYHLKNGRVIKRQYQICYSTPEYHLAARLIGGDY